MFSPPIGNRYAWFDDVGLVHATKSCRLPRPVSSPKLPAKGGHGTTGKKKINGKICPTHKKYAKPWIFNRNPSRYQLLMVESVT